jgi:uncharacterized protein YbjT (DUF2867 family)
VRILLTGGSGFTGGFVIQNLTKHRHHVSAVVRSGQAKIKVESRGAEPLLADLDDADSLTRAFKHAEADAFVNLASMGFGHAPVVVNAAEFAQVQRALFVSTTAIFTKLTSQSKNTRLTAENIITRSSLNWSIVRPTMIYGAPGDRNIERLVRLLWRSPIVPIPRNGAGLQQPVHVEDLAEAIVTAIESPATVRQVYDVGGPEALSLRRLVHETALALSRSPMIIRIPVGPVRGTLRLAARAGIRTSITAEQVERLNENKSIDITRATADLAYRPRSFASGVAAEVKLLCQ